MGAIVVKAIGEVDFRDFKAAQRELDKMRRSAETLDNKIRRVGDSFGRAGERMKRFGGTMSRFVTAPIGALGVASIRSAVDFETSMARIQGLVGVAAEDIGELADAARALGPQYGASANEAGDALFFITSAGLRGASAIETLESSLKASAIGLGETAVVADLLTSSVNAYGEANLSATEATDVLVNAVRLGKLMPEELAGSMGMVLPVASAMGVEFHEVGAAFAAMSRTGTDASMAATQLRQILSTILNPTAEARTELDKYGLSADGLREQLRERGLLSVLQTLTSTLGLNDDAIARVFGNIRALSGVLDLMGSNVQATTEIFDGMAESTGVADDAMGAIADTAGQRFKVALETSKTAMMEAATETLPVLTELADKIGELATDFREMTDEQQRSFLKMAGVAAVAGPAIIVLGQLATAVRGLAAAFVFLMAHPVVALFALTAGLIVYSVTLAKTTEEQEAFREAQVRSLEETNATVAGYRELGRRAEIASGQTRALAEASRSAARGAFTARREAEKWTDAMAENEARRFGLAAEQARNARYAEEEAALLAELEAQAQAVADAMNVAGDEIGGATEKTVRLDDETRTLLQTLNDVYVGSSESGDAIAEYARDLLAAGRISESSANEIRALASAVRDDLNRALSDAERQLGDALRLFNDYRDSIAGGVRDGNRLADAVGAQSDAVARLARAEEDYARAQEQGDPQRIAEASEELEAARDAQGSFLSFLEQNALTAEEFAKQIDALRTAGASLEVTQEIAQLGAETGGRIIAELLAGGAEAIRQANDLTAAVEKAAIDAGTVAAQQFYGAGVNAAHALVDGVRSQIDALDDLLEEIVSKIEAAFSRVGGAPAAPGTTTTTTTVTTGGETGGGPAPTPIRRGGGIGGGIRLMADGGLVTGPTFAMVGEAGPELVVPLDRLGDFGGTTNINITVTSADPQAVVEAIRKFTRRNGPLGASVTL